MGKSDILHKPDDEAILDLTQQKKLLKVIATITLLVFVPLGIKNIIVGELMLGIVLLAFEISLLLEVAAIVYNKQTFFSYYLPLCLLVTSSILTVGIFGTLGTYWLYPVVIGIIFLLRKREAIISNAIVISASGYATTMHVDYSVSARYVISLIVTAILVHVVVKAVRKLQVDMHNLLVRDPMTGAFNRHELNISLEKAIQQYTTSTIAIIDVDRFKYINDRYGHDEGDNVLMMIVRTFNRFTGPTDKLFRLGGDEFLLLFHGRERVLTEEIMNYIAKEIRHTVHANSTGVSISVGIAESEPFKHIREWMKRADLALYESKRLGRDRVSCYTPSMSAQFEQREVEISRRTNLR
ncbi:MULTISPECIES: GGDEF domain-containing protein [Vibrio]|uniref:diguanylate cyclase n=1 Tax=Vibrio bivalvicida TaxID=1276888 RepID=A0A177XVT7_9VIBR|nr:MULTISPECIES: diguanylate cyclase [Vibrio]KLN66521.1 diguanylate cyclase [Vibrio sp. VPAP30]OAJ92707.1 diguanylate cyclase [Vibrio bivalvicida]